MKKLLEIQEVNRNVVIKQFVGGEKFLYLGKEYELNALGVDPVHFGMIFIVNIMIGGLTPPFGSMMFTVCSIIGVTLEDFVKKVWPFIVALLVVLLLVTYSESIALFTLNLFR